MMLPANRASTHLRCQHFFSPPRPLRWRRLLASAQELVHLGFCLHSASAQPFELQLRAAVFTAADTSSPSLQNAPVARTAHYLLR